MPLGILQFAFLKGGFFKETSLKNPSISSKNNFALKKKKKQTFYLPLKKKNYPI